MGKQNCVGTRQSERDASRAQQVPSSNMVEGGALQFSGDPQVGDGPRSMV